MSHLAALCGRGARLRGLAALGGMGGTRRLHRAGEDPPRRKTAPLTRITLISPEDELSITELTSALSLAQRRDLKLVKIQDLDSKTRRPVYKLMSNTDYHKEELLKRKEKREAKQNANKGEKLLTISSKIAQNDLMTRGNKVAKWLNKQYEIRVVITGESEDKMQSSEDIYTKIEDQVKTLGKIVQKRTKGNSLRFQILPEKLKHSDSLPTTQKNEQESEDKNKTSKEQGPL